MKPSIDKELYKNIDESEVIDGTHYGYGCIDFSSQKYAEVARLEKLGTGVEILHYDDESIHYSIHEF